LKKAGNNFSAYVPDLPGSIATGATVPEVETEIRDAIRFHIKGLRADGLDVPKGVSLAEYVEA
jgi:predicted RNase H-like HicB family nuclease